MSAVATDRPFPAQLKIIGRAAEVTDDEARTLAKVIMATHSNLDDIPYAYLAELARMARNVLIRRPDLRPFYEKHR